MFNRLISSKNRFNNFWFLTRNQFPPFNRVAYRRSLQVQYLPHLGPPVSKSSYRDETKQIAGISSNLIATALKNLVRRYVEVIRSLFGKGHQIDSGFDLATQLIIFLECFNKICATKNALIIRLGFIIWRLLDATPFKATAHKLGTLALDNAIRNKLPIQLTRRRKVIRKYQEDYQKIQAAASMPKAA